MKRISKEPDLSLEVASLLPSCTSLVNVRTGTIEVFDPPLTEKELESRIVRVIYDFLNLLPKETSGELCLNSIQIEAFRRVWWHFSTNQGLILADEMGLGKSRVIIVFMAFVHYFLPDKFPFLLVVPQHLLQNPWLSEIRRFTELKPFKCFPRGTAERLHGWYSLLSRDQHTTPQIPHVIITTYEGIRTDYPILSKMQFMGVVIDEAQYIKNWNSKLHRTLQ